jgi:uncharacterized phage-associated protein
MMLRARDVADYFLTRVDEEAGDSLSNLKLQKLVYYAQGFHLANYRRPLFQEPIEAWEHGPVVPQLYHAFKQHGATPILRPASFNLRIFSPRIVELLDEVSSVFGQFSAWKLRNMTHAEPPWRDAYESESKVISHDSMRRYFSSLLVDVAKS